jgi:hypothetical protein
VVHGTLEKHLLPFEAAFAPRLASTFFGFTIFLVQAAGFFKGMAGSHSDLAPTAFKAFSRHTGSS